MPLRAPKALSLFLECSFSKDSFYFSFLMKDDPGTVMVSDTLAAIHLYLSVIRCRAAAPKGMMFCRPQRLISIHPSAVLLSDAFWTFCLLEGGRPDGQMYGHMDRCTNGWTDRRKLPHVLQGSGPKGCTSDKMESMTQ